MSGEERLTRDQQVAALGAQYERIMMKEEGTPRTIAALDTQLAALGLDYRLFDASRPSPEIRAEIESQVRDTVGERAASLYARLVRGAEASLDSRRVGGGENLGERIREYVAYSGQGFGVLDPTGARSTSEMETALGDMERTFHAGRAVRMFNDIEHDRNANPGILQNVSLGLIGGNSPQREDRRLQLAGRELLQAGINADSDGDGRYSLNEVEAQVQALRGASGNRGHGGRGGNSD